MKSASEATHTKPLSELSVAIVSDAAPHRNGVGAYYHDLAQHIRDEVGSVLMVSPTIRDGVWEGGFMLPLPGDTSQKFCIPYFPTLSRQLREANPDVVIVPTPGLYGLAGARYGKKLGARVVIGFHTWYEKLTELYWNRLQGSVTRGYFYVSNKLLFRYADCVLANSEFMLDVARDLGAKRTQLMGTPVSYEMIHQPLAPVPERIDSVLFAGRLAAEKNIDDILAAAEALPQIRFSIAGDGPDRSKVEQRAAQLPNLTYLSWLDRARLLAQIDSHAMLLLPSQVESFGTIALEGMARRRCTLVSRDCGICEWSELTPGLFLMEPGESVTAAIERIAGQPTEQLQQVASRGRDAAVAFNRWNCDHWLETLAGG